MGKPMGNGLPLAGTVARTELVDAFRDRKRYFNTFASSPLQAAVGMAVLEVIEAENLRENVADVGEYLRTELTKTPTTLSTYGRGARARLVHWVGVGE